MADSTGTPDQQPLQVTRRGGALIVTINREARRNSLSRATLDAFRDVRAQLGPEDRAVVLTGEGERAFCAGADLKERREMSREQVLDQLEAYATHLGWLAESPVPTVAAINGAALGGGLELALLCDLRIAAKHAVFALPETRLGIIPGAGGTQRLPRLVGPAKARELILVGTRLSAEEALDCGLLHRVVEPEKDLLDQTLSWLGPVLEGAPIAQRCALDALRAAERLDLPAGLSFERESYQACLDSEDRLEALQAFADKRPPIFRGR